MSTHQTQPAIFEAQNDLAGKYLTFYIDETIYGVELVHVIEIISIQTIAAVPDVPDYIKGIINLRGRIVPVLDVRLRIGMPQRPYDDHTCIIVIEYEEMTVGMIVDSVYEVASFVSEDLSTLPQFTHINAKQYLSSISRIGDRLVLNLDCKQFLCAN